jgi:hypothetical protein
MKALILCLVALCACSSGVGQTTGEGSDPADDASPIASSDGGSTPTAPDAPSSSGPSPALTLPEASTPDSGSASASGANDSGVDTGADASPGECVQALSCPPGFPYMPADAGTVMTAAGELHTCCDYAPGDM